jgi:hypothetical protein
MTSIARPFCLSSWGNFLIITAQYWFMTLNPQSLGFHISHIKPSCLPVEDHDKDREHLIGTTKYLVHLFRTVFKRQYKNVLTTIASIYLESIELNLVPNYIACQTSHGVLILAHSALQFMRYIKQLACIPINAAFHRRGACQLDIKAL